MKSKKLTKREVEVLTWLVATDAYEKEIAEKMSIKLDTVKNYRKSIYRKLSLRSGVKIDSRLRLCNVLIQLAYENRTEILMSE